MQNSNSSYFWKKREIVMFLLCVLILFIHLPTFVNYPGDGQLISKINSFMSILIKECFTRFAVPLYFILSGMVFFKDYNNKLYVTKVKKRVHSLLIPYFIWNIVWMLFQIVLSYSPLNQYFTGREIFEFTLPNILKGIFLYGCNGPFWFVFDLFIFVLLSPIINLLIKNKYVAIFAATAVMLLATQGYGLPSEIFFTPSAFGYYLIGCVAGKHYFDKLSTKSKPIVSYISVLFLIAGAVYQYALNTEMIAENNLVHAFFIIGTAFAFWFFADLFADKVKSRKIHKYSFPIYAMHINIVSIFTKLIFLILPKSPYFALINCILTVILTLTSIYLFCTILSKYLPKLYNVIMGNH